jgi:hypothetical protein
MRLNHCHRVTAQLQLINIIITANQLYAISNYMEQKLQSQNYSRNPSTCVKSTRSLPCIQQPATGPNSEPNKFGLQPLTPFYKLKFNALQITFLFQIPRLIFYTPCPSHVNQKTFSSQPSLFHYFNNVWWRTAYSLCISSCMETRSVMVPTWYKIKT